MSRYFGSLSGKASPMSPSPAAPSRASHRACKTTSASLCPIRPFGCSMRSPPRTSGRSAPSRCVSCPMPMRMDPPPRVARAYGDCSRAAERRTTRPGRSRAAAEAALDREVLEAHVLLDVHQGDVAGRPVALLADDDLDDALVLA